MSETQTKTKTRQDLADQLRLDYLHVFSGDHGKAVLADLRRYCGYDAALFVPGSSDHTAYNLGNRDVFLYVLAKLADPPVEPVQEQAKTESSLDPKEP